MKYFSTLLLLFYGFALASQTAPNFTVTNSDGIVKNLYNDYLNQGKVVVIEAFFTTCPPCNTHAPYWQALYQSQLAAHPNQVEFMMLSTLQTDNNGKVATYKNNKGLTMPGVGNDGGSLSALLPYMTGQFGEFQGTPTFILIDTDGQVVFDIRGPSPQITMDLIAQAVATALSQTCAIQSPFNTPIADVHISATASNLTANITASGTYTLSNLPQLQSAAYTVSASKTDNALNGLTTFDLVKISKHIIGLETFTEPWQMVAADMNCSGTVTTFDIVVGRKLILGIDTELPCGSWKFVPQGSPDVSNGGCVDFIGVKLGDITGPYFAPPPSERSAYSLYAADRMVKAGERFILQLTASEKMAVQSFQLDLETSPNSLQINQITSSQLSGFDSGCFNLSAASTGHLPILWIDGNTVELEPGASVLSIELTAMQAGKLSDMLHLRPEGLTAEMYDADARPVEIGLQWQDSGAAPGPSAQLFPNPAHKSFQVNYDSPEASASLLQIIDIQGNVVDEKVVSLEKGSNLIPVLLENITPGLHAVKLNGRSLGSILLGL